MKIYSFYNYAHLLYQSFIAKKYKVDLLILHKENKSHKHWFGCNANIVNIIKLHENLIVKVNVQ